VQALNDIRFSSQMDRVKCKPWGLQGGHSGFGNSVALHRYGQNDETHFPNGKALNQVLKPGDAYILRSGGGGGYGLPVERDLGALAHDVRCGYVSRDAAETVYGAVFRADGTIDADASARRRQEMAAKGLPVDQPIAETIAPLPFNAEAVASPTPGVENLSDEERIALAMNCRCCS